MFCSKRNVACSWYGYIAKGREFRYKQENVSIDYEERDDSRFYRLECMEVGT